MAAAPIAANACTSFVLAAQDGSYVYGRTMEFSMPLHSQLMVIPRNHAFTGTGPDGTAGAGLSWTSKYGAAGANALGLNILVDGMNEKGLGGGMLYLPNYAEFQDVAPGEAKNSIASIELLTWILTNFATIDEVKENLPKIKVNKAPQETFKMPVPLHVTLHDLQGKSLVIEYVGGKLNMYDNPIGTLTNAPEFPWHLANLGLYGNLSPNEPPARKIGGESFAGPSTGAGMHGIPGDFLSPSRFIRATMFADSLPPLATGLDAMDAARHILDNFDIPPGAIRTEAGSDVGGGVAGWETTEWSAVADLKRGIYAIWDYKNPNPRALIFSELDLDAKDIRTVSFEVKPDFVNLSK
ncbi:choloylglycine hydrolase family protein [Ancylobacter mangrovi]|uniref:choloylglycine hydrolase family protein n=1 Tax=Ancylobacter mangrovi TaxID=2972472 RepID=UPI002163253E|nr:choloylglycine hydrolase family protein [Ancylobacter mangrovi]MCS0501509.1 choloylglycine hydrolase family protein [Ancylobacter mangrovi]